MRAFIAVDLEDSIKDRLITLVENLKPAGRNIKWVARENFHLTLKFLGEIEEAQAETVRQTLIKLTHQYQPFSLKLKGTGSFPPGQNRMRVIWVGLEAAPELFRFQKEKLQCFSIGPAIHCPPLSCQTLWRQTEVKWRRCPHPLLK